MSHRTAELALLVLGALATGSCAVGDPAPSPAPEVRASVAGGSSAAPVRPVEPTAERSARSLPAPAPEPPPAPPAPTYPATVAEITPDLAARMATSWREGCPVPLADLRYLTVTYRDFDGGVATGELVVHADVAAGVVEVFRALFVLGYPVRSMRLVDDFGGSDDASMAQDNTSAFNCRPISRGSGWSEHAYGRAIDLNPRENPYVRGDLVLPPEGAEFAARPDAPGVVHADDAVVRAFAAQGWQWGGYWTSPTDYQHFSVTGR
ncbi:M15 family metallopeptidase [Cellulomonas hominis]